MYVHFPSVWLKQDHIDVESLLTGKALSVSVSDGEIRGGVCGFITDCWFILNVAA